MVLLIEIMIIATVIIATVIIVIVILVIVLLVMLVIVWKIMCMLILVCVKKVFNFLLGGQSINNSRREWMEGSIFKYQMKSGAYSNTPILWWLLQALFQSINTYYYWPAMVFCSIGSNRIVIVLLLLLPRASILKKQLRQASRASSNQMKIIILYLKIMMNMVKSKINYYTTV